MVRVPEAEPMVADLRAQYDAAARWGMPAHVTVLYPWLREGEVNQQVLADLEALALDAVGFDAALSAVGRFAATLFLAPTPSSGFSALTDAVWKRWPELPPYGGRFDSVIPHLTVADAQPTGVLDAVADEIERGGLPVRFSVEALSLFAFDGTRWVERHTFPLGTGEHQQR